MAPILLNCLERCARSGALHIKSQNRLVARADREIQGGAVLFNSAALCARRRFRGSCHPQIANSFARGEWKSVGMGRVFSREWLLPWFMHARVRMRRLSPHLYPQLERTLRDLELVRSMDERGHVNFRGAIPDGPVDHNGPAAADGQLGGIMKVYREWQISGDSDWLKKAVYPGEAKPRLLHSHLVPGSPDARAV